MGLAGESKRAAASVWAFDLPPAKLSKTSVVVVGGVPQGLKLPSALAGKNLVGEVDRIVINGVRKGLWNWEVSTLFLDLNQSYPSVPAIHWLLRMFLAFDLYCLLCVMEIVS